MNTEHAITLLEAIDRWQHRLRNRERAENTVKAYLTAAIDAAQSFARRDAHLVSAVAARHIDGWLDDMSRRKLSMRTQMLKLTALRMLFAYCIREEWIDTNPCRDLKLKFKVKAVVAPELPVLHSLIDAIPTGKKATWRDHRDRALLRLALDAALRSGGLIALNIPGGREPHTVDLQRLQVSTCNKGGSTTEPIAINQKTADAVATWLEARKAIATDRDHALFINNRGGRITRSTTNNIARARGKVVGVEGIYIHLFRHRRAGDLIERVGVKVAQNHLQHANASTTVGMYGAHANKHSREAVRREADIDVDQRKGKST